MSLREFIEEMKAERLTVTVYGDDSRPELSERLSEWNVAVRTDTLPEGTTDEFLTVRQGDTFVGGLDVEVLSDFFEPTITSPGTSPDESSNIDAVLDLLDETLFHATERRQLLATSREIEDRAVRVGSGRLHVGFQNPRSFAAQAGVYEYLVEQGLNVHVYLDGDWDVASISGVTPHTTTDGELGEFWFVAFDDDPDERAGAETSNADAGAQACALLAEEREPGSYSGFWTYDPKRVGALNSYLETTYC